MSKIDELRKVRYEHRKVAYTVGELNSKIAMEPNRNDLKSMRFKCTKELQRLDLRRFELLSEIKASPYALVDVVSVLDSLSNVQSQIACGGAEEGQMAISAFIRNLTQDKDRLTELEDGESIPVEEPSKKELYTEQSWRSLAGTRQGVINKLDKKIRRLEDENAYLRERLTEGATK